MKFRLTYELRGYFSSLYTVYGKGFAFYSPCHHCRMIWMITTIIGWQDAVDHLLNKAYSWRQSSWYTHSSWRETTIRGYGGVGKWRNLGSDIDLAKILIYPFQLTWNYFTRVRRSREVKKSQKQYRSCENLDIPIPVDVRLLYEGAEESGSEEISEAIQISRKWIFS